MTPLQRLVSAVSDRLKRRKWCRRRESNLRPYLFDVQRRRIAQQLPRAVGAVRDRAESMMETIMSYQA